MKNFVLLSVTAGLFAVTGCSSDQEITGPASSSPVPAESEFPVNEAMPGAETEFALATTASQNIVDTAVTAGFNTLVAAVQAEGLEEALRGEGPLTVFAPTNEAFARLPEGLVDELLLPENVALLQDLLLYHVTSGQVLSTDLRRFQRVEMLQGDRTWVTKNLRGEVRVNFSKVVVADVLATNGVAHVIDGVLIPLHFYGLLRSLPAEAPVFDEQFELSQSE